MTNHQGPQIDQRDATEFELGAGGVGVLGDALVMAATSAESFGWAAAPDGTPATSPAPRITGAAKATARSFLLIMMVLSTFTGVRTCVWRPGVQLALLRCPAGYPRLKPVRAGPQCSYS